MSLCQGISEEETIVLSRHGEAFSLPTGTVDSPSSTGISVVTGVHSGQPLSRPPANSVIGGSKTPTVGVLPFSCYEQAGIFAWLQ